MIQSQSKGQKWSTHKTIFNILTITSLAKVITASSVTLNAGTADESRILLATSDITTPKFGGCFNTDNDRLTCTATGSCQSGEYYLTPSDDSLSKCDSPFRVEVGRCKLGNGDLGSCTPFASTCDSGEFDLDPTCSLVEDKSSGPDKLTHYPFCRSLNVQPPFGVRCVLSKEDCLTGDEEFLNFEDAKDLPHCFCADVPTGMCYKDTDEDITADTSFCALGVFDCPDGYDFMPAYELSKKANPIRKCRLCAEEDISKYELHESVLESGRCISEDGSFGNCELEETMCNEGFGETFQSSSQLADVGFFGCHSNLFPGGDCTTNAGEKICVNYADACQSPLSFVKRESCTIFADTASQDNDPMYFGKCQTSGNTEGVGFRCVWQESECGDVEQWLPASKPTDWYDGCKCEDVETGACRDDDGIYYCAVSELGCALDHTYVSSLETKGAGLDCRLCQRSRTKKAVTASPLKSPVTSPTDIFSSLQTPVSPPVSSPLKPTVSPTYEPTKSGLTFAPTPTAMNGAYDDDSEDVFDDDSYDYDDDDGVGRFSAEQREADVYVIIVGTVGGSFLFICVALMLWFQELLPVKFYRTDEELVGDRGIVAKSINVI